MKTDDIHFRLEVYLTMLAKLIELMYKPYPIGFCYLLNSTIDILIKSFDLKYIYTHKNLELYPELYNYKPINTDVWWWNGYDREIRIETLKKVIADTELIIINNKLC